MLDEVQFFSNYPLSNLFFRFQLYFYDLTDRNYLQMPYCLLMDGLAKAGQILEAKSVFDEMKKKDVTSGTFSDRSISLLTTHS